MKKPIIICVDDEETVLDSLKEQLKREFKNEVDIEVTYSAEEAIEVFNELTTENAEIPIIISDQVMPGMKGDEFLIKIHLIAPKTLKILLTGQANADAVGRVVNQANLYRFIGKPWEKGDLYLTVKEALRSYFQDRTLEEKNILLEEKNKALEKNIDTFNKFVPKQFLKILNIDKDKDHIELGQCAEESITILFSDIFSFTTYAENATPDETFSFINDHLKRMGPIIRKNNGFIDKFIGDAIMAIFLCADDAVKSALGMIEDMNRFNQDVIHSKQGNPYSIGFGINSGIVMMGTVGETDRLETTVIGDAVNLASRIQDLTRKYNSTLLISENTYNELKNPDKYSIKNVGQVNVDGRKEVVNIYEVMGFAG